MQKPASPRPRRALAAAVKRHVRRRSYDKVRRLAVIVKDGKVTVRGSAPSYYLKQLALEGARICLEGTGMMLHLEIDVP
jgi:hypothetical protein